MNIQKGMIVIVIKVEIHESMNTYEYSQESRVKGGVGNKLSHVHKENGSGKILL